MNGRSIGTPLSMISAARPCRLTVPAAAEASASWSRRTVISGLSALGAALVTGRSLGREAAPADALCRVMIDSAMGPIEVSLDLEHAPLSAGDFLEYVDRGLFAGGAFYRTVRADNDPNPVKIRVVQGGLTDESKFLAPIAHEPTNRTGLRHRDGTISIGRDEVGTGSAGAFFICIGDQPELDFGGKRNPDGQGFAAFGQVTRGMEVVRSIGASKTRGPKGSAGGESIAAPVSIVGVRRL